MIDEKTILEKYSELCVKYENNQIDDFETFIKSRLVEYILNTCHEDIDYTVELVNKIVEKEDDQ